MGYSGRYHAASLAAVFLALAVGILIGVGFGSDIISGTAADLEQSLESDLEQARADVGDLEAELQAEREFEQAVYPAIVGGRLESRRIALVGFGGASPELVADVEQALAGTGGALAEVAIATSPPRLDALAETLSGRRARALTRGDRTALEAFGLDAGRLMVRGGARFDDLRGTLFSRYSGRATGIDAVIVARERPEGLSPPETADSDSLEDGLIAGLRSVQIPVVGIELSAADPSQVEFFDSTGLSTVDSVDLLSGKVALVFALAGAEGNFGIKETADSLLPELIEGDPPTAEVPADVEPGPPAGNGADSAQRGR